MKIDNVQKFVPNHCMLKICLKFFINGKNIKKFNRFLLILINVRQSLVEIIANPYKNMNIFYSDQISIS